MKYSQILHIMDAEFVDAQPVPLVEIDSYKYIVLPIPKRYGENKYMRSMILSDELGWLDWRWDECRMDGYGIGYPHRIIPERTLKFGVFPVEVTDSECNYVFEGFRWYIKPRIKITYINKLRESITNEVIYSTIKSYTKDKDRIMEMLSPDYSISPDYYYLVDGENLLSFRDLDKAKTINPDLMLKP